jgi:hypothetical protein
MQCPYCAEQIKDSAIVCHFCHRDLLFFRPLLDRLTKLEAEILKLTDLVNKLADAPVAVMPLISSPVVSDSPSFFTVERSFWIAVAGAIFGLAGGIALNTHVVRSEWMFLGSVLSPMLFRSMARESGRFPPDAVLRPRRSHGWYCLLARYSFPEQGRRGLHPSHEQEFPSGSIFCNRRRDPLRVRWSYLTALSRAGTLTRAEHICQGTCHSSSWP